MVHVLLADELVVDAEAATVLEDAVEVTGAHQATMLVPVATQRSVLVMLMVVMIVMMVMIMIVMVVMVVMVVVVMVMMFVMVMIVMIVVMMVVVVMVMMVMMIVAKVLNDNRVARAHLEAISLHALP